MNDDAALLRSYLDDQSEAAFTALVQRHLGLVYATARRQLGGDAHLAEDVAQAVFTKLARKAGSLRGHGTLAGWLYVSARLASAAEVRREQRRKSREMTARSMQLNESSETPELSGDRLGALLEEAIVRLKADDREVVVLRFFQQRTFLEIGAALQITEEAARKRVERALERLHAVLSRRGITSTAVASAAALIATGAPSVPAGLATKVASQALHAGAAAGGGALALGLSSLLMPAVVIALSALVLVPQHRANQAAARELTELVEQNSSIAALQAQERRLERSLAWVREKEADVAALQARLQALPLPKPITARSAVVITEQGMIQWEGEYVTLQDFLDRLASLHASATNGESELTIRANRVLYRQMLYALDEARKAGIDHIRVESDAAADSNSPFSWF